MQNDNTKFTDRVVKSSKWLYGFSLVKFVKIVGIRMVRNLPTFENGLALFVISSMTETSMPVRTS